MNGGSRIIRIRTASGPAPVEPETVASDAPEEEIYTDVLEDEPVGSSGLVWPTVAASVSSAWVVGMTMFAWPGLAALPPVALTEFVAALCVPPALVAILLLIAMRNSRAETRRFNDVARAMRSESTNLERTVAALSARIDADRQALVAHAAELNGVGESASIRLRESSSEMVAETKILDTISAGIVDAASKASSSLDILFNSLPKAHAELVGMSDTLRTTGLSAGERSAELSGHLAALAERGRAADEIANGAASKLAAHITRMEATSETAGARLESVTAEMATAVDGLLDRTAGAVDEARKGIAAQGEALLAMLGTNQAALDRAGRDSAEALAARISSIEALIDQVASRLSAQRDAGDSMVGSLESGIGNVALQLDALHAQGVDRSQMLAASISALGGSADAMTEALRTGDTMATAAISTTERLLTALDAAAREIDETMPEALTRLDARIADSRLVVSQAKPELLSLVTAAESTHDAIEAIAQVIANQRDTANTLSGTLLDTLSSSREKADALGVMVEDTIGRTHRFAEEAAPRLVEALLRVRDTASAAADRARETLATVIPEAAEALERESGDAMRRASAAAVEQQLASISDAAEAAADAAARASERLTRQMLAIADSTAVVESRIEEAREARERADNDSFSRRVSLLIEALNSASIDITKSFSAEVSDSAWAAYLKGDRGVFTRRAVRLLDASEAREIARLYDDDGEFREQVNRYIHDFEAMLRAILAQRAGSPLGVTLLSSDMGKLYVALAQAIERLRT